MTLDEGRQISVSMGVGARLPGGRHGMMVVMYVLVRSRPMLWSILSRS